MHEHHLGVQDAVDYISSLHYSTLDLFIDHFEADMPSWGVKLDSSVATYLRGLQDCIVASLHWSFETERYFGSNRYRVKERGLVTLTPRG
jgi:alpha-muurolene/germacrene-A/gamma-muurolene synthase